MFHQNAFYNPHYLERGVFMAVLRRIHLQSLQKPKQH
jgi:hypothetical protein